MSFKITTLVENLVYIPGMKAEHGLSFYIETDHGTILFDTGQTDVLIQNAERKNIDLSKVDLVVISHGHYDHSGGLEAFFAVNHHAPVYLKSEALQIKYSSDGRKIGMKRDLRETANRFQFVNEVLEILPNVFIMPHIPIIHQLDTHFEQMKTEIDNQRQADTFMDELFLVIRHNNSLAVLSSCSHRGITNICDAAIAQFDLPISTVLGGFHTRNASNEQLEHISNYFTLHHPQKLGICHCTGLNGFSFFQKKLGESVFYNGIGSIVCL